MQHDPAIDAEVLRLRGASDDQLRACDREREAKRVAWYAKQTPLPAAGDPLEKAYRLLLRKLGIDEDDAPIVRRDDTTIVFHSRNFCPTLAACVVLGLDTRRVCRLSSEKSTDALVKLVDPRLSFSRNYQKLRPYSDSCEESISYHDAPVGREQGKSLSSS